MKIRLFILAAAVLTLASITPAQQAMGVGGNIKPAKVKHVKAAKEKKGAPLYTVPKSEPWYLNYGKGGPGPAGAGTKS